MMFKPFITGLTSFTIAVSAVAAVPDMPEPKGNKFAVQLFKIVSPGAFDPRSFKRNNESIERLFTDATNAITSYPTVYAELGVRATHDRTLSVKMPIDYNLVNGEVVPVEESRALGVKVAVTVTAYKNETTTFTLHFSHQEIKGHEDVKLREGVTARKPLFEKREVNTELSQTLGSWVVLGGITSGESADEHTTHYLIRITRPVATFTEPAGRWRPI